MHAENKRVPMKCALNCVHGCLAKCSHVFSADGPTRSKACYDDCTKTCLPTCAARGGAGGAELADLASRAARDGSVETAGYAAHTGAPTAGLELFGAGLPRGGASY